MTTFPFFRWLRSNPLVSFFALAFFFTWSNWVPRALASRGLLNVNVPDFMFVVAGYGPAIAALIMSGVVKGRVGLRSLGKRLVHWRVGACWYFVALFLPAAQTLAAFGLHRLFGAEIPNAGPVPG